MSVLSSFFHKAAAFVTNAVQSAPSDQQATLNNAASQLATAGQAIEGAMPVLAKVVLDAGLTAVGGGTYIPAINEFYDALIAEIQSRKTK